jgi:hypothetical protein
MWAPAGRQAGKAAKRQAGQAARRQGGKATLDIAHSRCLIHS